MRLLMRPRYHAWPKLPRWAEWLQYSLIVLVSTMYLTERFLEAFG